MNFIKSLLLFHLFTGAWTLHAATQNPTLVPIMINRPGTRLMVVSAKDLKSIKAFHFDLSGTTDLNAIKGIRIVSGTPHRYNRELKSAAESYVIRKKMVVHCAETLIGPQGEFSVFIQMKEDADLLNKVAIKLTGIESAKGRISKTSKGTKPMVYRLGVSIVDRDEILGARIPGITTTPKGTLLAIFDARYESARDLQGHMDIGMKRSTDGGQTWSKMKPIIDMGEWGGLPEKYNGVSDACILVDDNTGKIFVAGVWLHGVKDSEGRWIGAQGWNHQWRQGGSMPGLGVKETAQFMMVESSDDGVTWSKPVNLTKKLKKPEWHLFAPAPGRGITMKNGTLVMPTEGKNKDGIGFSNFIYSIDKGKTWAVSEHAATDLFTTEGQIAELQNGSLMLNMRSALAGKATDITRTGRAVCVTKDMGRTWTKHPTSGTALPEPSCSAGLLAHTPHKLLVFSNPPNLRIKGNRRRMTMKFSTDDGMTWPEKYHILLDVPKGAYSCLTSVDKDTVGILYEGSQAKICFQKISVLELGLP